MNVSRLRLAAALGAIVLLCGCGDDALWARWNADREFWRVRREVDRLQLNPKLTSSADYAKVEARFAAIAARYPASRWARPGLVPPARDVGVTSGRAALAAAQLAELRERESEALAAYAGVEAEYAAVLPVALEAALGRANALERFGHSQEALRAWERIAATYPIVDPETGDPIAEVLDAALRVAPGRAAAGDPAGADSILAASERRIEEQLRRSTGGRAAPDLWSRLSRVRAARGHWDASLDALRHALHEPAAARDVPRLVLDLTQASLDAGRPDSALAYAHWAEQDFGGVARPDGMMMAAEAWERLGAPDSAEAAYQRFLDDYAQIPHASAEARFRRGVLFEGQGRWEEARTEYRTLTAEQPTDPLGLEAMHRIVAYHAAHGQDDLARTEGRRALETIQQILTTQRDDSVQFHARRTRADVLVEMRDPVAAENALEDLWRRYPETDAGLEAALRGAELAEVGLHDRARAVNLYREVAESTRNEDARRKALAALTRLGAASR